MRKVLKKVTAILLAIAMLAGLLPVVVSAEETTEDTAEEEYIYYSDLFYGYPSYLMKVPTIINHNQETQAILNTVYSEYRKSPSFMWSNIEEALPTAFDLKEWTKKVTDMVGLTSFTYEKALDAANVDLVTHILGGSAIASAYGDGAKWIKKFNNILKVYDNFDKTYDVKIMTEEETFTAMLAVLDDSDVLASVSSTHIRTLSEDLLPHISSITKILSVGGDVLTAAKTIATGVMLEDFRMELIDDILRNTPSDTMLYDGMLRLKNQLQDGFVTYFLENYVRDEVLNDIADKLVKNITKETMQAIAEEAVANYYLNLYSLVGAVVKVSSWIIFDVIFQVPDIDDLTKQMVLSEYAHNFYNILQEKAKLFNSQFNTSDIFAFETLATAYIAATNAALSASEKVKLSSNEETLAEITEKYEGDGFYDTWIESVIDFIKRIPMEERNITNFGTWTLTGDTILTSGSDTIEEGYLYFVNHEFNGTIKSTEYGEDLTVAENENLTINGDLDLTTCNKKITVPESAVLTITGDLYHNCYDDSGAQSAEFYNYGTVYVGGNVSMAGNYSYTFGGNAHSDFENHGDLKVSGSIFLNETDGTLSNYGSIDVGGDIELYNRSTLENNSVIYVNSILLNSSSYYEDSVVKMHEDAARIFLKGNFINDDSVDNTDITAGTLIFEGTEQQTIDTLKVKNMEVTNPAGIKYLSDLNLYGEYKLNENPLDNNGFNTICYPGATFDDVSNYGVLTIAYKETFSISQPQLLCESITGSYFTLVVEEGTVLKTCGDIKVGTATKFYNYGTTNIGGAFHMSGGSNNTFANYGEFSVDGNFTVYRYQNGRIKFNLYPHSVLDVKMDVSIDSATEKSISDSALLKLSGTQQQTVSGASYIRTIVLDNPSEEGVVFSSSIDPTVLFNHNGNNFTLADNGAYSKFVDYDGDGLKDNVDPEPTVGNPCTLYFTSEDTEKGTVSMDELETVGGTQITVVATPTAKYAFSKWMNSAGETVSTSAECTLVATGEETYTAVFAKRQQPISTQTDGGSINVVSKAEIESAVTVSVTENDGYIYTEGSLACNGIPVEGSSFIMPDEPVVLTAEFVRNDSYFLLKDALDAASAYGYEAYSAISFSALQEVIATAENALQNNISATDSEVHIAALEYAVANLADKYIVALSLPTSPVLYKGVESMLGACAVSVTYDNGTEAGITVADCTVEGFDASVTGEQSVTLSYNGFCAAFSVSVQLRPIAECVFDEVASQSYHSAECTPLVTGTFPVADETLEEGVDYSVVYADNVNVGTATVTVTGIGDYTGSHTLTFEIVPIELDNAVAGRSLTLSNDLTLTYKVEKKYFEEYGYNNPCIEFTMFAADMSKVLASATVEEYTVDGEYLVFAFEEIRPQWIDGQIDVKICADFNGAENSAYSVIGDSVYQYCMELLSLYSDDTYAEMRTLVLDLLGYGAATQVYMNGSTDLLSSLTAEQLAWGTADTPEMASVLNTAYAKIASPSVKWKAAGLVLSEAIDIRLKIQADDITDLSVKASTDDGQEWTLGEEAFSPADSGQYYIRFTGLNASQLSEAVYFTVYDGEIAVSHTLCYSVESYAYSKQNSTDTALAELVIAMMKYGNAAYNYIH